MCLYPQDSERHRAEESRKNGEWVGYVFFQQLLSIAIIVSQSKMQRTLSSIVNVVQPAKGLQPLTILNLI